MVELPVTDAEAAAVLRHACDVGEIDSDAEWAAIERAIELLEANDAEWAGPGMGSA